MDNLLMFQCEECSGLTFYVYADGVVCFKCGEEYDIEEIEISKE